MSKRALTADIWGTYRSYVGVRRLKPGFRVYMELLMEDIRLNLSASDAWNLGYCFTKAIHVLIPKP